MKFIWPEMLLWLLAVPLLVAAYVYWLRRKKKGAVRYPSLALLRAAMGPGDRAADGDGDAPVAAADDHPRDRRVAQHGRDRRRSQSTDRRTDRGEILRR